MRGVWFWWGWLLPLWLMACAPGHAAPLQFEAAEAAVSSRPEGANWAETMALIDAQRPPEAGPWAPVALPVSLPRQVLPAGAPEATALMRWYRVRYSVPASAAGTALALYTARVRAGPLLVLVRTGAGGVWQPVYQSGERWLDQWNRPLLVALPADTLEVVLGASGAEGQAHAVSTLWVGPLEALRERAEWRLWWQQRAPMVTSTAILIVGLFALGVWWRRRHEQAYLFFALASMVWGFRNLHYSIDLPRDDLVWSWFWWATHASLAWAMLLTFRFALRFDDRGHRLLAHGLLAGVLLSTLVGLPVWFWAVDVVVLQHVVNAAVALTVTIYMSALAWRGGGAELRAMAAASWVAQAFGVNDLLLLAGRTSPENIYLLPYAPLVVFASFLYATLRRYVQAIEQVESANSTLEARLLEREAELEANHLRLRSVEKAQALLLERQRLMADMHDGFGSTLTSSLIMLEQGQIDSAGAARLMRECVDDLRLVIDSLEPIEQDLGALLATLRYRLGRRMEAAGVALEWAIEDLPPLPWLAPPDALQVLRLLQEVLTNVLKHADARTVRMATRQTLQGDVEVCISDDGVGFDAAAVAVRGGRGLSNLRLRARQLGAKLEMLSVPGQGTTVRLLLPLQRAAV